MAAGPWTRTAGLGQANQPLVTALVTELITPQANNVSLMTDPVMIGILAADRSLGPITGALGIQISYTSVGTGTMDTVAEGTASTPTDFDTTDITITPSRRAHSRKLSDWGVATLESLLDPRLAPSAMALVLKDGMGTYINTIVGDILDLATSASNEVGTSGGKLTWSVLHNMVIDMAANGGVGAGGLILVLTGKGVQDLASDSISLSGAASMSGQIQQFMNSDPTSPYVGSFFNGKVRIYMSPSVATDGSDTVGACFSEAGVKTKHEQVPLGPAAVVVAEAGFLTVEAIRGAGGMTTMETVTHFGVALGDPSAFYAVRYAS